MQGSKHSNNQNFMQIDQIQNPFEKRELFAVSLRKSKKKSILIEKRKKLTLSAKTLLNTTFCEYQGYLKENPSFETEFKTICGQKLPQISDLLSNHETVWPTIENVKQIVEVMTVVDDFETTVSCLTILRRSFTEFDESVFSIADLIHGTNLISALGASLQKPGQQQNTIECEVLWVLLNMSYCCTTQQDCDALVNCLSMSKESEQLVAKQQGSLSSIFAGSFQVTKECSEATNLQELQKLDLSLQIIGNLQLHRKPSVLDLISSHKCFEQLATLIIEYSNEPHSQIQAGFYEEFTNDLGPWLVPHQIKLLCKLTAPIDETQFDSVYKLNFMLMETTKQPNSFRAMADLLGKIFSLEQESISHDQLQVLLDDIIEPSSADAALYKHCCGIIGQICAIESPHYLQFLTKDKTVTSILSCLEKSLDICKIQSDDDTLADIFWALSNLAQTQERTVDICSAITTSQIWLSDIANVDIRWKSKKVRTEMVCAIVKVLYPFTLDLQEYRYQILEILQGNMLPQTLVWSLTQVRGQHLDQLLEVINAVCYLDFYEFSQARDGEDSLILMMEKAGIARGIEYVWSNNVTHSEQTATLASQIIDTYFKDEQEELISDNQLR